MMVVAATADGGEGRARFKWSGLVRRDKRDSIFYLCL